MRTTLRRALAGLGNIALTMAIMGFGVVYFAHVSVPNIDLTSYSDLNFRNFRYATDFVVTCGSFQEVNAVIVAARKTPDGSPQRGLQLLRGHGRTGCDTLQLRYDVGMVVKSVAASNGIGVYRVEHVMSTASYRSSANEGWDVTDVNWFYVRLDQDIPM